MNRRKHVPQGDTDTPGKPPGKKQVLADDREQKHADSN